MDKLKHAHIMHRSAIGIEGLGEKAVEFASHRPLTTVHREPWLSQSRRGLGGCAKVAKNCSESPLSHLSLVFACCVLPLPTIDSSRSLHTNIFYLVRP